MRRDRTVGYIRVSDKSQIDGYSLDAQRSEIGRWADRRSLELVGFYEEHGRSARFERIEKRPELIRLLDDAKQGQFEIVVVHTIDRWSRNVGVQRQALQRLGDAKVGFASVQQENMDFTTPEGKLLLTMLGAVNEFFSDQLGFHVSKAKKQRAEEGLPPGPPPFAYAVNEAGGVAVIRKAEGEALREAFERRAGGESTGQIADWLNRQGFKTKSGNPFTAHAMKDIFNCRFYTGVVLYKGREHTGQHEALITQDLFDRVQARRSMGPRQRKVWGATGLLQGKLSCGNCGSPLQSDRHRFGTPMYRERHALPCLTNERSIVSRTFDDQMEQIICSMELPGQWQERMATLATAMYDGPSLTELEEDRRRLGVAYLNRGFSDRAYKARLSDLDARIARANAVVPPTYAEAAALFQKIPNLWKEATAEERRRLLSPLIERVYVDMELKLVGAITPSPTFRALLQCAVQKSGSNVVLVSKDDMESLGVWSWWRRGRIELPVQKKYVRDLLQA